MIQQRNYTTLSSIASGLDKVKWHGDYEFLACCPAHDDRNPSFSVADKNGKILVKCWAGCSQESVIGALRGMGLWHSASRHQIERRKRADLEKDIRHHYQIILLGAAQTTELSEADMAQMRESFGFLGLYK